MKRGKRTIIIFLAVILVGIGAVVTIHTVNQSKWQDHYEAGLNFLKEDNYEEAIIEFSAAIKINDRKAEAYTGRAKAYVLGNMEEKAISDYSKVISLDETAADAYIGLGTIYNEKKDYKQAIKILNQGYKATGSKDIYNKLYHWFYGFENSKEMFLGKKLSEIEKQFGKLKILSETEFKIWYNVPGTDWKIFIYPKVSQECRGIALSAEKLFGVKENVKLQTFCETNKIGYMTPDGKLSILEKDAEPIINAVNSKFPDDKFNSSSHWYFGEKPGETGDEFEEQVLGEIHEKNTSYSIRVLTNHEQIQPGSLCSIEYYAQYDYWRYKHETKISLDYSKVKMLPDSYFQVNVIAQKTIGSASESLKIDGTSVKWTSNNPSVAKVDEQGRITGVNPGTAVITAEYEGDSCKTVVKVYPLDIAKVKTALGVPKNIETTVELYEEINYWNAGQEWLFYIEFLERGNLIAAAECDITTCTPKRGILGYTAK